MKLRNRAADEAAWADFNRARVEKRLRSSRPETLNAESAAALLDQRPFIFRRVAYRVPPIPWPDAVRLVQANADLRSIQARVNADPNAEVEVFGRISEIAKDLARPQNWLRRLVWRFTPNPFRKATPWEVGTLVGFFCGCLTRDQPSQDRMIPLPGILHQNSPDSSPATPRGSATESRSPGPTS